MVTEKFIPRSTEDMSMERKAATSLGELLDRNGQLPTVQLTTEIGTFVGLAPAETDKLTPMGPFDERYDTFISVSVLQATHASKSTMVEIGRLNLVLFRPKGNVDMNTSWLDSVSSAGGEENVRRVILGASSYLNQLVG